MEEIFKIQDLESQKSFHKIMKIRHEEFSNGESQLVPREFNEKCSLGGPQLIS